MEGETDTSTYLTTVDGNDKELENTDDGCTCEYSKNTETDAAEEEIQCECKCQSSPLTSTSIEPQEDKILVPKPHKATPLSYNEDSKKPKLRTSKDIYDRLKWDSESVLVKSSNKSKSESKEELDVSSVYIGYKDRFLGMCELPFEEFTPGDDIPFHRIYYFRTGGPPIEPFIGRDGEVKVREDNLPEGAVFIWDRDSRTDLVFYSGNSTIVEKKRSRKNQSRSMIS